MSNLPLILRVCRADYADPLHATAVVSLLDAYARDPMGGGEGLSDFAKAQLVPALAARPTAFFQLLQHIAITYFGTHQLYAL
jgi:hypothetical protein